MVTSMMLHISSAASIHYVFDSSYIFLSPFFFLFDAILITLVPLRFFMEKQVMGEFVRILRICKSLIVSRQLLQTMSIMIQNLKSEHSICELSY